MTIGEYIFDVFETTKKNSLPDLYVGLAMHQHENPIPDGVTDREIREFIGKHYNELVEAFKLNARGAFAATVEQLQKADEEAAKAKAEQA